MFEWLIDQGLIGFYHPRRRTKEGEIWVDFEWAFPTCAYHPPAFYGMHLKWFARDGRSGWRYEPRGCLAVPLVVGDLPEADLVIVGESTWDTIAAIDLYKMHNWSEADGRRATIATRGPANLNTCPSSRSSRQRRLNCYGRNDTADDEWLIPEVFFVEMCAVFLEEG